MRALSWLLSAVAFHGAATAQLPVEVHRQPQELLTSDEARLAANKKLVFDFWRVVRQAHHAERTPEYLAERYAPVVSAAAKAGKNLLYSGYPITPASDLLHNLSSFKHFGVRTFQAEDEIAAICAAIGAC